MTKVVVLKSNEVVPRPDLVGTWLDSSHYHTLVEEDMDLYLPPSCAVEMAAEDSCDNNMNCGSCTKGLNEQNIVFKFRKGYFDQEMVKSAYEGLKDAAQPTENRGTAAGPRTESLGNREWVTAYQDEVLKYLKNPKANIFGEDPLKDIENQFADKEIASNRNNVWSITRTKEDNFVFDEWVDKVRNMSAEEQQSEAEYVEKNYVCSTTYANSVNSGIAGWYDRYPRIPFARPTTYTRDNPEKFAKSYPYLQELAEAFKDLLPWRYGNQMAAAESIDPKFVIPGTPFSTVTVNKNFRTAAHYDPANMDNGFANICVFSNNDKYSGAYLVFPEIGYAVNIRPGDLLFVNNMAGLHGNTELVLEDPEAERISAIAFFHEKMLHVGSYEYEDYRRQFVELNKNDQTNPYWKPRFNGVFPGMWADTEDAKSDYSQAESWYKFLKQHTKGDEWLDKHHPWLKKRFEDKGLEEFF